MPYWWESDARDCYWVEITDRDNIGGDLNCPQRNEKRKPYWSYDLINSILPGEIIFHYYLPKKLFIGASVAGGPLRLPERGQRIVTGSRCS